MLSMKKSFSNALSLFLLCNALYGVEANAETVKERIAKEISLLKQVSSHQEKSSVFFRLAMAYWEDQELDKAFLSFLESLKSAPHGEIPELHENEKSFYGEALQYYLAQASSDPQKTAQELIAKYGEIGREHPDYLHLNFLLSTAFANNGNYALFFEHFYAGYSKLWDTFLAYKTQGILYLRLSQRSATLEQKRSYQKEAERFLNLALERNGHDSGVYKILIGLAKEVKNDSLELSYLQKMVRAAPLIPRGDIFLYVQEAVALEEYELGQEIIDQARQQYEMSRVIAAAQDYLDQHKQS